MQDLHNAKIAVLGLGYVGLPLAIEFGVKFQTIGFDINQARVLELNKNVDSTLEVDEGDFNRAVNLSFSSTPDHIKDCNVYIVTVPTPIDAFKSPNLGPLVAASRTIGDLISKGDVVIYESTVYPGATEEVCIPEIETLSGLKYNVDFFAGYSPERINPGDKQHRLPTIVKVTSGSTLETAEFVEDEIFPRITAFIAQLEQDKEVRIEYRAPYFFKVTKYHQRKPRAPPQPRILPKGHMQLDSVQKVAFKEYGFKTEEANQSHVAAYEKVNGILKTNFRGVNNMPAWMTNKE